MGEGTTMRDWFRDLWEDIKDDPVNFILGIFMWLIIISFIVFIIALLYCICTGKMTGGSDNDVHGMVPIPMGKSFIFLPY